MRLTIAYSKITKRNLVLINNATYQKETLSERPIRQPLSLKITSLLQSKHPCVVARSADFSVLRDPIYYPIDSINIPKLFIKKKKNLLA